jgi:hypothetical protein
MTGTPVAAYSIFFGALLAGGIQAQDFPLSFTNRQLSVRSSCVYLFLFKRICWEVFYHFNRGKSTHFFKKNNYSPPFAFSREQFYQWN